MTDRPMTLWQTIDRLAQQMPFTEEKVEDVLGAQLHLKSRDEYLSHWIGGPVQLKGGVNIANSSLALGPNGAFDANSGLSLELSDGCITLAQVREHYSDLRIVQVPRGRSSLETTVHQATQSWGAVSFAFRADNPACLFRVSLRPAQTS